MADAYTCPECGRSDCNGWCKVSMPRSLQTAGALQIGGFTLAAAQFFVDGPLAHITLAAAAVFVFVLTGRAIQEHRALTGR